MKQISLFTVLVVIAVLGPRSAFTQTNTAEFHYKVAIAALNDGNLDVGLQELETAAKLAPDNALVQYNLAIVKQKKGEPGEALVYLQRALSLGLPADLKVKANDLLPVWTYEVQKANQIAREEIDRREQELDRAMEFLKVTLPKRLNLGKEQGRRETNVDEYSLRLEDEVEVESSRGRVSSRTQFQSMDWEDISTKILLGGVSYRRTVTLNCEGGRPCIKAIGPRSEGISSVTLEFHYLDVSLNEIEQALKVVLEEAHR
jgi:tetratricopeptide (TPR) repeat protein